MPNASVGHLQSFIEGDNFVEYLMQADIFFEANEIASDDEKRALLLTVIGKKTFLLLRNLLQPREMKSVPYNKIINVLTDYYSPASSIIMERFRFHNLKQGNEDIATFIVKIKELASKCNFGAFLNDAPRQIDIYPKLPLQKLEVIICQRKRDQDDQKSYFNRNAVKRNFDINDSVWVKSTRNENVKWYPGKITKVISLNTFLVSTDNKTRHVHSDHLGKSEIDVVDDSNFSRFRTTMDSNVNKPSVRNAILSALDIAIKHNVEITQGNSTNYTLSNAELSTSNSVSSPISESVTSPIKSTRPKRNIKPPKRYSHES
ncbi:hypothetical protein AVEN_265303-1 [Araneus ventricosus]|uniref:Retrotransposon gag domain-containing protein n=1 Tax=Araneus ventricosus TaxID=182803 RepID=A0A4Y2EM60_ARAVE|nr:hypothetical protein AVEN_265303-1 [Araneus ventricosus]